MQNLNPVKACCFSLLSILLVLGCSKSEDDQDPTIIGDSIDALVREAQLPPPPAPLDVQRDTAEAEFDIQANFVCQEVEVSAQGAPGDYRTFNPNSNVVWPGNLLQGKTLTKSTPESIDVKRAAGVFTIDLVNGSTGTKKEVPEVTQAEVIGAINEIISVNTGVLAANFSYTAREVRSKQEMALALGVSVETITTEFDAQVSVNTEREYNSFLVDFVQQYYTISYQAPTSYDEVFDPSVSAADLDPYIGPENPPVYISSVTYGRRYYLLITSTSSAADIRASIQASYDAALANGSLDVDATYVQELDEVEISVFAMGGDAQLAAQTFGGDFETVRTFLANGGTINTGAVLSYKMETLAAPHQDVGVGIATNFTIPHCRPAYGKIPPAFTHSWFGIFDNQGIGAACSIDSDQDNMLLFNQAGTEYAQIIGGEVVGVFTLGAANDQGRLAGCPIYPAGAAQVLGEAIRIYSRDGLTYVWLDGNGVWGEIRDLYLWGDPDGNHPFLQPTGGGGPGVGAAFQSRWGAGTTERSVHFNQAGNRYVVYTGGSYDGPFLLDDWGGSISDIPFANVGPGLLVKTDQNIGANGTPGYYEFLFNAEGTAFTIFGDGGFTEVYKIAMD